MQKIKVLACVIAAAILLPYGKYLDDNSEAISIQLARIFNLAPEYIPLTDLQAANYQVDAMTQLRREIYSETYEEVISSNKNRHYRYYLQTEIQPIEGKLKIGVQVGIFILLAWLALVALKNTLQLIPWGKINRSVSVAAERGGQVARKTGVAGMFASRRLRRYEEDFSRLKKLHENGMISDEKFESRKTKIKQKINSD